jgi:hypothetical protein
MIKSLITEYGLPWVINRSLYSAKLKMIRAIPISDKLFERNVNVKRIDIFSLKVEWIEEFLNGLSNKKKKEIISIADNAIEGKILGFSSSLLDYGNPINWHFNPITKVEVNRSLKWYKIPDFDPERGDIKSIWEASRFTHFFYFVRAYMITRDSKYFDAFSKQLDEWLRNNHYPYGSNFKCGQEATLRMISALITYSAFKSYGLTTQKDKENLHKLVTGSYKKVISNFFYAHKCIKNNHTLSEIVGLIIGAWSCNDIRGLKKAYALLDEEVQKQFYRDGGYIQYSFNYQRFALQLMELVFKMGEKTNVNISEQSKDILRNSAFLMYQMQDETGDVPNYGSNDGALIFPVTSCGYRDFRPVINTIANLIDGKRIYNSGDYDEELLWFGNKPLDDLPISIVEKKSSAFDKSGFYSLRHNAGFLMTVLQDFKTRPAQMDQNHIDLWHNGINVFCDSGTYSYATDIGKEMSLTAAHNTVKVKGKEQMKKHGPFLIYDWTCSRDVNHDEISFKGTMTSKNGYEHTRTIERIKQGYSITDNIFGGCEYCEVNFHTPCEVNIIATGFELYDKGQLICNVLTTGGVVEVKKACRSLYYLKKDDINCISVRYNMVDSKCRAIFELKLSS